MTSCFAGIFPMLVTPFDSSGRVALDELTAIVVRQLDAGVTGLSLLGLAGESGGLTLDERKKISRHVLSIAPGVPVVVGCTAPNTAQATELATEAVEAGAAIIMIAPPPKPEWSRHTLLDHYAVVARAIYPTSLMVQDAPAFVGVALDASFVIELAKSSPNVLYAKPESLPAVDAVATLASVSRIGIFGGHGGLYFFDVLAAGADGLIPGCEQPRNFQRIYEQWIKHDVEAARAEFHRILPLLVCQFQYLDCFIASVKTLLHAQGLLRHPSLRGQPWPLSCTSRRTLLEHARRAGAI
jgi:4-hydroxy-tetrahydrodipicolinate synthase